MAKRFKRDKEELQAFFEDSFPAFFAVNLDHHSVIDDVRSGTILHDGTWRRDRQQFFNRKVQS